MNQQICQGWVWCEVKLWDFREGGARGEEDVKAAPCRGMWLWQRLVASFYSSFAGQNPGVGVQSLEQCSPNLVPKSSCPSPGFPLLAKQNRAGPSN